MSASHRRRPRRGFTLMEVLLVMVIIVILGSFATFAFQNVFSDTDVKTASGQSKLFSTPISTYWLHVRQYPTSLQALVEPPTDVDATKWKGPYIDKIPKDPWGNDYRIKAPGTHNPNTFDVWSAGPDGVDGTEDDVGNWDKPS
jgi:general secretion pathway protein G